MSNWIFPRFDFMREGFRGELGKVVNVRWFIQKAFRCENITLCSGCNPDLETKHEILINDSNCYSAIRDNNVR